MIELDLHGMKTTEALQALTIKYNCLANNCQKELLVVHGYGSTGAGGVLKRKVRSFLKSAGVEFFTEKEMAFCNRGQTLVKVGKQALSLGSELEKKMLQFCKPAKTKEKIFSKFHKSGTEALQKAFVALVKKGMLQEKQKGKYKVYEMRS